MRIPNPGEKKKDYLNRELFKEILKPKHTSINVLGTSRATSQIEVLGILNDDASPDTVAPYEIFKFDETMSPFDPVESDTTFSHLRSPVIGGYRFSQSGKRHLGWGVALDFITKTNPGRVLVAGATWINTESIDLASVPNYVTHLELLNNVLTPGFCGRARAVHGINKPHTLVILGEYCPTKRGKTDGALSVNTVGDVFVYDLTASGYSLTARKEKAITDVSDIPANTEILLIPAEGGRQYAVKLC